MSTESVDINAKPRLTVGPNEQIGWGQSVVLGLQHMLAMDVYVVPFIVAIILGLSTGDASALIRSTFITAGVATIVQAGLLMKLPVAQGASYIPIGAAVGITMAHGGGMEGWGVAIGASLVGALVVVALGLSGVFNKFINHFVPPLVGGTIILCVGLSLMPAAVRDNIINAQAGSVGQNVALAGVSAVTMLICAVIGDRLGGPARILRIGSVIIGLLAGSLVAASWGLLDLSPVGAAPWFAAPMLPGVNFSLQFDVAAILTFLVIYLALLAETTGTWLTVANVIDEKLTDEQINRGVLGEGIGCGVGALLGTTPVTGYSTNAGIISITGVASRQVFLAAGGLFVVFGLSGKLSALISVIPSPVVGGVFALVCSVIAVAGLRVLHDQPLGQRATWIVGLPIVSVFAITFLPADVAQTLPSIVQYLISSALAVAALVAIILNLVLPRD